MTAHEPSPFRITVMRVVAELQDKKHGPVRAIEIYSHPALKGEESKRISNTLFNCKNAAKALLVQNVSSEFEVTAAGNAFLAEHANPPTLTMENIPAFYSRPAEIAIEPPIKIQPGAVYYVPDTSPQAHVHATIRDLEQKLEQQRQAMAATEELIDNIRKLLLNDPKPSI